MNVLMTVTAKKLLLALGGAVFGFGGTWLAFRPHPHPRPVPVAASPAARYDIKPLVLLPPVNVSAASAPSKTAVPPKPEASPAPARSAKLGKRSADDPMRGAVVTAPASERLALREGRGRIGRLRPASASARIRPAASENVDEPTVDVAREAPSAVETPRGSLAPGALEQAISAHRVEIRGCARKRDDGSEPRGKLALRWTVLPDGRVQDVRVGEGGNIDDAELSQCVVNRVARWRFSPPEGGPAPVSSTFVFM
jgi:hypothetical protein